MSSNFNHMDKLCEHIEHEENTFFHSIKELYDETFKKVCYFKGNESDKVYYKSFFNIDERVIDITNVIVIASKSNFSINKEQTQIDYIKEKINLGINPYLNDLY